MKILLVAGARPNFIKIAPIIRAFRNKNEKTANKNVTVELIHTGQHYDYDMSQAFFDDLKIPRPDFFLNAGSDSHAAQTAKIMIEFEKVCLNERPDLVIVVGDVNSTLACSIVAKKLMIRVAHVEAGLRSFDLSMPEEINRIVTDSISDYFFATEESAVINLLKEGKSLDDIHFVGNVMVDNLFFQLEQLKTIDCASFDSAVIKESLGKYIFMTLHRPSNVDNRDTLQGIVDAINEIAAMIPVIFPVHPRTKRNLEKFKIGFNEEVFLLNPLSFKESLYLWKDAVMVLTDSGGLQEETTGLGVPCITLRENTERPVTVELGSNCIAGNKKNNILKMFESRLKQNKKTNHIPPKWDGRAAERIVKIISQLPPQERVA